MGNDSAVATKPDTYETSKGMERMRLQPRPTFIPQSLNELIALGEGNLEKLTKPQLIRTLMTFKQKLQEYLQSVSSPAAEELSDKLTVKRAELVQRVGQIMNDYPIRYSADLHSKRTKPVAHNILYALVMGCSLEDAAHLAGVGNDFMSSWRTDDPDGFALAVNTARSVFDSLIVDDAVFRLLVGGEVKRTRTLYKDGEIDSEIVDLTTPDARVAIAAKNRFRQTTEQRGRIDHYLHLLTPEQEARLRKHGDQIVEEEIKALEGQGREES
jgi:hypothetical protein